MLYAIFAIFAPRNRILWRCHEIEDWRFDEVLVIVGNVICTGQNAIYAQVDRHEFGAILFFAVEHAQQTGTHTNYYARRPVHIVDPPNDRLFACGNDDSWPKYGHRQHIARLLLFVSVVVLNVVRGLLAILIVNATVAHGSHQILGQCLCVCISVRPVAN